jgi:beta-lactamase regulating signal transducer with metallopeptidase domain
MDMLQQPYGQALASALGHFIWQGAVLGLAAHLVIRAGRLGANARYAVGVICLITMAATPIATTIYLAHGASGTWSGVRDATIEDGHATARSVAAVGRLTSASLSTRDLQAGVVLSWLVGVMLLSLRLLGGWVMTRRLVDGARGLAAPEIRGLAHRVAERLALARLVEVFESPTVAVPMMVGWIKPCVILPTAALAGLTPVQVEALLAHELAHVRRHDYLVNLLQSAIETLLFYHPAVWWISRDVREAREHCCDDLAVAVCDRVVYASALADLAALARTTAGQRFALAATDGSLVWRVRRILSGADDGRGSKPAWLPAVLLALTIAGLAPIVLSSASVAEAPGLRTVPHEAQRGAPAKSQTASPASAPSGTQAEPRVEDARPVVSSGGEQEQDRDQIEKLRAMLARLEGDLARIGGPEQGRQLEVMRDELAAAVDKLKEAQALRERSGEARIKDREPLNNDDQLREMEAKLAAAESELNGPARSLKGAKHKLLLGPPGPPSDDAPDQVNELKANLAQLNEVRAQLAMRDEQALGDQNDEMKAKLANLEAASAASIAALKARRDAEQAQADRGLEARDLEAQIAAIEQQKAERREARANEGSATEVDSKRVLSLIGPALKAGPGEISVVGDVKHPGPIKWDAGLTAAVAVMHAGGPSADDVDIQIGRLSEMNLTWSADGPDSRVRIDIVEPSTTLHAGDVIVVTATKRK